MTNKRILLVDPPVWAVSKAQLYNYAEPFPYGLLKLGSWLKRQGHEVKLIDLMVYDHLEKANASVWPAGAEVRSYKHAGAPGVTDRLKPAYHLGKPFSHLREKLVEYGRPDAIWVTACLTYNWETAWEAVRIAREVYPDVPVSLGGNYPTLLPDHAAASGADEVRPGPIEEAETEFGDLSLFEATPTVGLFNFADGCSNRCTFCVNHKRRPVLRHGAKPLLHYLLSARMRFGIKHFSNWDPNVMLFPQVLEEFLDLVIAARPGLTFGFNMGIQPDLLTAPFIEKMLQAGVTQLTIPFESSDPAMLRRYRKPYNFDATVAAMRRVRQAGFQVGRFHATAVFGYDDEDPRHLFRTYLAMLMLGAQPDFFPICPTPGSVEYERLLPVLKGKPHDELNGYLFPLLTSAEKVDLYDLLLELCCENDLDRALTLSRRLPAELERVFLEELEGARKW